MTTSRFDLQKSQSRVDHLEVRLADALEELQKRPTLSSSSPNASTPSGDKGQEGLVGVAESGASNSGGIGKEEKVATEEVWY